MAQPCGASKTTSLSTYTRPPSARSPRSRSSAATCMPRRYGGSTKTTTKRGRAPRAKSPPMIRTVLGLVRRTDDDDRELFGIDALRKGAPHLREGHRFDARGKLVEPVERQPVEADHGDLLEDLAVGVDAQGKSADEALFRRFQLRFGGPVLHELADDRARQLERLARLVAPRLQSHQKRSRALVGPEVAVGAVCVAALLAYFPQEPRHESAASQGVVADEERKVVRVGSGERRDAQQHVALGGRVRHAQGRTRGQRRDRRQR